MSLPWEVETDGKIEHCTQKGLLCALNGQIQSVGFCECQTYHILQSKDLICIDHNIKGVAYRCVYTSQTGHNPFASKLFGCPITGNAMIYIPDRDLTQVDIDFLMNIYRQS